MNDTKIKTSVVVPLYNEARFIDECLSSLLKQKGAEFGRDYEIIVVDDGSTDASAQKVKRHPVELVSFSKNRGKIEARRIGARCARYEHILFVDARVCVSRDILEQCWRIGYSPLLSGRQYDLEKDDMQAAERLFYLIRRCYYYPYFPLSQDRKTLFIDRNNFFRAPKGTTCLFIAKDLFLEAIPEHFDGHSNDDSALFDYIVNKKGIKLLRHYNVAITYSHRLNQKELSVWVARRGVTFFDFYITRNPLLFFALVIMPWVMGASIIAYCIYSLQNLLYIFFGLLLFYAMIVLFMIEKRGDFLLVFFQLYKYAFFFYKGMIRGWHVRRKGLITNE